MRYLNEERLERARWQDLQRRAPYPWMGLENSLTLDGFERLRQTLPDVARFTRSTGVKRPYGQAPYDRYLLHYQPGLELAEPWREFVEELQGLDYRRFLNRMLGPEMFLLTFEWCYAWQGCSMPPHCDPAWKRATHFFYFNTEKDWDPDWGGEILILDSGRRFRSHSAPGFDDLRVAASLETWGNESLLVQRTPHSWHGARPLSCPPGRLRKMFVVSVNLSTIQVRWRHWRGQDPDGYPLMRHRTAA